MIESGESSVIFSLTDSPLTPKLMEMGFLPGKEVRLVRKAPGGSPLYFDLNGHYVALRKEEANSIVLEAGAK